MPSQQAYAHSRVGEPEQHWEPLLDHLNQVARLAASFAAAFDSSDWGHLAGLWHDLGKYRPEFQRRLRGSGEQAPHASVGAALAQQTRLPPIAFAIAGHHAGLANHAEQLDTKQLPLKQRIAEGQELLQALHPILPRELIEHPTPTPPSLLSRAAGGGGAHQTELWIRFLFSALIDADRLATEAFYEPGKRADLRPYDDIATLRGRLDDALARFTCQSMVNSLRSRVLADCRASAVLHPPGLFSLTVPTGGGKTLSSMAFALAHAERHGLRRVIVVIPYTSIIEQSAAVYRAVLGDANVIEHHSAVDEAIQSVDKEREVRRRLAVENWDAPIIVTTSVQFFESLFSNEPSRCRKLHNVARSVVIVDEAQTLPTDLLLCLVDGMRELVRAYGCSLVLSTATQPALGRRHALPRGLADVREIIHDPNALAFALDRVDVQWPAPAPATTPLSAIASEMQEHSQALAIVHQRRDARVLAELLPPEARFHLSTRMCSAHRAAVLGSIRRLLDDGAPCRVVSTQLVEAGVDIDFPLVFRALAGLDSLAQAAGRCNRNGSLTDQAGSPARGQFIVFRAESLPPRGTLRKGLEIAEAMLVARNGALDLRDCQTLEEYFRRLYLSSDLDVRGVMSQRSSFNFATVAKLVRFIDDGTTHPIVVPWGEPREVRRRVSRFEQHPCRETSRALQPFIVQIRQHELRSLQLAGAVAELEGFGYVLSPTHQHLYSDEFGLSLDEPGDADPDSLIV